MRPTSSVSSIDSPARLVGAAIALDAERVGTLSPAELKLPSEPVHHTQAHALRARVLAGEDPLGEAFCALRSPEVRRADGAVYTPERIVTAMTDWAEQGPTPVQIIDPGSGSARFAVSAGRRFPKASIVAVELDPLAAIISRANLAVWGMSDRARVVVNDYRSYTPRKVSGSTLYLGNPPYVRHHEITGKWKQWLSNTALKRGLSASQLAGLHVHFFLAIAEHSSPGDRGALITSSEWLDVNYGALVRDLLLDGLGGLAIQVISPEAQPFEGVQTTGAITCFEIGSRPSTLKLRRVKSITDLGKLEGGQAVRRERLADAQRWTPLLRAARKVPAGHIQLGELCRVHRGAATGANRVWVIDIEETDLPLRFLYRTVTRARELFLAGVSLSNAGKLRAVVDLPADLNELNETERRSAERFLRVARRLGVHKGYLARHRRVWWSIGMREPAPILATYMARRPPAIVRNLARARHINIAHGLYPRDPLSSETLDRIAEALRGSIQVGEGRTYAGGLTKFEPGEMERLLIPDVTQGVT
jgi:adenine-specific DNA-methyltransferase